MVKIRSPSISITVSTVTYNLTISVDKTTVYVDEEVKVTGRLTRDGVGLAGKEVVLYVDGTATTIKTITDTNGYYTLSVKFTSAGTRTIFTEATV